jgi:3-hydroxyacyl-CoA dehydrogenase
LKRIAVIGSGVMGAGIAAHIANAGYKVLLFDIVLVNQEDRDFLPKEAIARLKKGKVLASASSEKLITPLNLEDDLDRLTDCDWIIEAITEKIDLKHDLYNKLKMHKKDSCIVSSNTSTIPLSELLKNMPEEFQEKFYITHFFNPPRHMRLLELVTHSKNLPEEINILEQFCIHQLGKEVVTCYDTPGFIANRLGCYWLEISMREAEKFNLTPSQVDLALTQYFNVPKTGVFGLYDLIGLDLMKLISESLTVSLSANDPYVNDTKTYPPFYTKLLAEGYMGKKSKGGFYRALDKQKQEFNLKTQEFQAITPPIIPPFHHLKELFTYQDSITNFICFSFLKFIHYTLTYATSICKNIYSIDQAMKTGYNWKFGPFELIDQLGKEFLIEQFTKNNFSVPELLKVNNKPFYTKKSFLEYSGEYTKFLSSNFIVLSNFKETKHPIYSSGSCNLWDIGDKVACLEFTSKMNILNEDIFETIIRIVDYINDTGTKLIIGSDKGVFSTGADLGYFMKCLEREDYEQIENFISLGQKAFNYLQSSEEKVVAAVNGYALGGGCELLLHTHQVVAHIESYIGLVEPSIGLIPGWGGCNQMIKKNTSQSYNNIISNIFLGKISNSALEAKEMHILNESDLVIMNKNNLLIEAKKLALQPKNTSLSITRNEPFQISSEELKSLATDSNHLLVLEKLTQIFLQTSKPTNKLEVKYFIELIKTPETRSKIIQLLKSKK